MKRLIIFLFALICGGAASQFPEFSQQYRQRLDGAVQELSKIVEQFDADARLSGLSRDEAVERYAQSGDDFLGKRGDSLKQVFARYDYLSQHQTDLMDANPFERLIVFAKSRDPELSQATLKIYEPAVPVTTEGGAHAAGGVVGGWALLSILLWPFGRRRRAQA